MASTTSLTDSRSNPGRLTVRALATAVGITADAVRFYERRGLLPAPERTPADYRSYTPAAIERLRFIQGAQRLGLRLREIRDLLAVRDTGVCPCGPAEVLLRRRIGDAIRRVERAQIARSRSRTV